MSYISELRKYVGQRPVINIGATVIVMNAQNEILLNLRKDTNTWGIIGGGMELGESLEETAARELHEEAGLAAGHFELLGVLSGRELYFAIRTVTRPIQSLRFTKRLEFPARCTSMTEKARICNTFR